MRLLHRTSLLLLTAVLGLAGCGTGEPAGRWAGPTASAGTTPSPTGTATGTATPSRAASPFDGRLPKFDPPPVPEKITLAGGPTAPLLNRIPTTQRVAFLTIDDGWVKKPEALALLKAAGIPVTLFLLGPVAAEKPDFFTDLHRNGATIQAHSLNHLSMPSLSYERQKQEICGSADQLGKLFGERPTLFRPPFGEYNQTTLRAARDCGMKAVFHWTQTVDKGKVRYQGEWGKMQPGDIMLMHFRDAYADDFLAALSAMKANNLTPALLESYLP
ncbi:polysaccharide deacetylase family protein [Longispora albida]|uniref:polysaccharide deacetylase family protein n=1 Tax=Longispora albida TaxID=203523 RepID=UPI00037DC391|nr:polysaccharide deacetylase family protein [Longispora albida]